MIDMEAIENVVSDERKVMQAGYMCYTSFLNRKFEAVEGLIKFGDPFYRSIGRALQYADLNNALKIMRYWRHECDQHALLYQIQQARLKAEEVTE